VRIAQKQVILSGVLDIAADMAANYPIQTLKTSKIA